MPPIGETLREARMRQRLDIADVEARTKIRAKYLRALENEEWSLLPGPTFVRTFLRTYAEVVGVDPHVLVEEYRVNHEPREDQELQALAPMPREKRRGPRRQSVGPPRRGPIALLVVGALVAFVFALGLLGGDDETGEPTATTTTQTRTERRPAGDRRPSRAPAPTGVSVRIAPTEPTYACVDTGPGTDLVYEGTLEVPRTFRSARRLRLNLGKRSVSVTVNGEPVEIVESAEPLGLALTTDRATELPAGSRPCA
jgi:cytoskeletal protein RodZ